MKSLSSFMKRGNPYGVIFIGDRKAIVGSPHGQPIPLTADVKARLAEIAEANGVWYEGNGDDVAPNASLFGSKSSYRGSWDDAFAKTVDGYPPHFLGGLFSNVEANGQARHFLDPSLSIAESLVEHQKGMRYFKDRAYDRATLDAFLRSVSDEAENFVAMAQKPATQTNLARFFKAGEARMFPRNWMEYPYKAGKVMKKVEDARNAFLIAQPAGVYVAGAGHLVEILKIKPTLTMVGGAKASQ